MSVFKKGSCLFMSLMIATMLVTTLNFRASEAATNDGTVNNKAIVSLELDNNFINFNRIGDTYQLKPKITPSDANNQTLKYSCNNPSVATVSSSGLVTSVGEGSASITIETTDGSLKALYVDIKFVVGYDSPLGIERKKNVDHGTVKEITYYSKVTGNKRKAMVYTPPHYSKKKKYNVLYLCHGINDTHITWCKNGFAHYILDNLYAEGKVKNMIVVMPNCYANKSDEDTSIKSGDKYKESIKAYDDFEFDLEKSLMPFIKKHYSVYTGSKHTALAGLSMGGRETCNIGLRRTDLFGYLGMFSPAPTSDPSDNFQSVLYNKIHTKYPPRLIWLSVGSCDTVAGQSTEQVKKVLESDEVQSYFKKNGTKYIYYKMQTKVSHYWPEWRNGLYNFTQMIFR